MSRSKKSKLLRAGDVIQIEKGMEIYAVIPARFVYSNATYSTKNAQTNLKVGVRLENAEFNTNLSKKIQKAVLDAIEFQVGIRPIKLTEEFVERVIMEAKSKLGEPSFDTSVLAGEYLVVSARSAGGSPDQNYPDGWHITALRMKDGAYDPAGTKIEFFQTGCFNATITPEQIQPIRHLRPRTVVRYD